MSAGSASVVRMTSTPALRALSDRLGDRLVLPDDEAYDAARSPWNLAIEQRPAAVAHPADVERLGREIKDLALDFGLVSPYTSFVAVDSESATGPEAPARVDQPAEVPAGVDPGNFKNER